MSIAGTTPRNSIRRAFTAISICFSTVRGEIPSSDAMSPVDLPSKRLIVNTFWRWGGSLAIAEAISCSSSDSTKPSKSNSQSSAIILWL